MRQQLAESKRIALAFFQQSGPARLLMLRMCLSPQVELMESVLVENEVGWETEQLSHSEAGEPRSYRALKHVLSCWGDGRFQQFLRKSKNIAESDTLWKHTLHTEGNATDILRMCSRASCVLMDLVMMKALSFPLLLFSLLHDDSQTELILTYHQDYPCCLDSFSKSFLDKFPTAEQLASPEARHILTAIAQCTYCNIYNVERTHTRHTARARHRMTHEISLADLAMFHQVTSQFPWLSDSAVSSFGVS